MKLTRETNALLFILTGHVHHLHHRRNHLMSQVVCLCCFPCVYVRVVLFSMYSSWVIWIADTSGFPSPRTPAAPLVDASAPVVAPPQKAQTPAQARTPAQAVAQAQALIRKTYPTSSAPPQQQQSSSSRLYTLAEVAKHNKATDCWVVINGIVLDVTKFLALHPGGQGVLLMMGGKDASKQFELLHKPGTFEEHATPYIIGKLGQANDQPEKKQPAAATSRVGQDSTALASFSKPNNPISLSPLQIAVPSNKESRNSGGTSHVLPAERATATFKSELLTNFLDGGPEKTKRKRFILSPTAGFDMSDKYYWERPELFKQHVKHFLDVHRSFWDSFRPTREDIQWMSEFALLSGSFGNHYGLGMPTIAGMGSPQQLKWWLHKAMTNELVLCYCQTELGHGSNVRGLQTIATFDRKTQEFVLNTPTLRSIKWWPGALGKLCTHALVYAQLILNGKEYGVHVFMVQVRDENHRPLVGIEIGDVGPKMGDAANDTGFLRLQNVRIPREHMLSRYQSVTSDGRYLKSRLKTNSKMHYATMMFSKLA